MRIDHLLERGEGIAGEVLVTLEGLHIYQARISLLGPTAKKTLANELQDRVNSVDWRILIEQAFTKTIELYRRGEETVKVGHLPKRESPKYRIKPLVLEKELNALYAFGGIGKSIVSQFCAVLVQCGINAVGFTAQQGNTLILDWETSQAKVDENIQAIKRGMNFNSPEEPFYRRCHRPLANEIYEIQALMAEKDIKFVIVDSANMAAGVSESFHASGLSLVGALRSLNCSILLIDHKPKKGESMFGTIIKSNACRALWELKGRQDEDTRDLELGFFQAKHNDYKWKPFGMKCEIKGTEEHLDELVFSQEEVTNIPEVSQSLNLPSRIISALKPHPLLVEELLEDLEIPQDKKNSLQVTLSRMKKAGKVVNLDDNQWGLVYREAT